MAQDDYVVSNDDGASFRADINSQLAAIKSNNSHASTFPASPVQGMPFTQVLSATQQLEWKYDGAAWRLLAIVDPTAGKVYHTNVRAISGLTLSNNGTDATNDIDIAAGWTAADTDGHPLILTAAITKRLDAAWAVGTNQGGLDTGSIADTTYHVWLIRRPDTGVVDVLFSASASSPTMPTDYTQKRRIGSIIRASAAIVAFAQVGDVFKRAEATDRSNTAAAASALLALSVPTGVVVQPLVHATLFVGASVTCAIFLGDAVNGSANIQIAGCLTGAGDSSDNIDNIFAGGFFTNTSAQVYFAQVNTAGTPATSQLRTFGWIDRRGQDTAA
jgi:hypothetical protein